MRTLLVALNAKFIHSSLALRYLQKSCTRAGMKDVWTAEYTINNQPWDILRHIYAYHADVIGFSCYIWNIEMIWHLIDLIKQVQPGVSIFVGGPEVSYTARQILMERPAVDYVLQGEGEDSVPALLQHLSSGGADTVIPGVLGRRDGQVWGSEAYAEVPDLSSLPFPYEEEDFGQLAHKIIYYESSRGCPFHCQYCLSGNNEVVRFLPVQRVIGELQQFVSAHVHQVKFVDRTFNCNPAHYRPLLAYMASVREPVNFHLEIEPGLLTDQDLDVLCRAPAGRIQLEIGIQSTYEKTLQAIRRHNDWQRIAHIMEVLRAAGTIHLHLDLIVGLPYEDYDHLCQSFNDIYSLRPHKLQIGFLKLLKGSGIRRDYPQSYQYDPLGPYEVLATEWLSYEHVAYLKIFEDVFERIYNSGKFIYTLLYLERSYKKNYFQMYAAMTDYWIACGYDVLAISDETLCQFLWQFIQKTDAGLAGQQGDVIRGLLSIDILTSFRFRLKLDFLGWQEIDRSATEAWWRNESAVRSYIPDYAFTNWRDIRMRFRMFYISEALQAELEHYIPAVPGPCCLLAEKRHGEVHWLLVPQRSLNESI